jgi:hypothetical protein
VQGPDLLENIAATGSAAQDLLQRDLRSGVGDLEGGLSPADLHHGLQVALHEDEQTGTMTPMSTIIMTSRAIAMPATSFISLSSTSVCSHIRTFALLRVFSTYPSNSPLK